MGGRIPFLIHVLSFLYSEQNVKSPQPPDFGGGGGGKAFIDEFKQTMKNFEYG